VFIALYIRDNVWRAYDMAWMGKLGGFFSGEHVPSGRFNAGEKIWFWVGVILFGVIVSVSGAILLFPNWNTTRDLMGEVNLVHASIACLFIAMAVGHIYLGTIGLAGAYQAMREGTVDEAWAKEHHELWYDEMKSGKSAHNMSGAPHPAAGDD
jgi:formate dehydrogenase subunit gamma